MPTGYQSLEEDGEKKGRRKPYGESHRACTSNGSCKRGHLSLCGHTNWSKATEGSSPMLRKKKNSLPLPGHFQFINRTPATYQSLTRQARLMSIYHYIIWLALDLYYL